MTVKVFFLALAISAAVTAAVVIWPIPGPAPVALGKPEADCSTCTARHRDKQRLRRELEKISDVQN